MSKKKDRTKYGGANLQQAKKQAFTNIPTGTANIALAKEPSTNHIPMDAGTIVVGMDPRTPPNFPPNLSMATVAKIATTAAKKNEDKKDHHVCRMGSVMTLICHFTAI